MSLLCGQTYDGTSKMSGDYPGCQAVISVVKPLASFVHSGAHFVNLVSQVAAESRTEIRDALRT